MSSNADGGEASRPSYAPRASRVFGVALLLTVPLTAGLAVWDRLIVSEDARSSTQLTGARIHIEKVTSLRRDTRKAHVALLESWLSPAAERPRTRPALSKMVATVEREHDEFRALPGASGDEEPLRARLAEAERDWAQLMSATISADHGPERLAEHQAALARVDREADAILGFNSRAGEAVDLHIALLRGRQKWVELGFVAGVLASLGLALFWRARRRADTRIREAKQLEETRAAQMRAQFFASMSHELRTPLVSITNLTTNFNDATSTSEERTKFAKHIDSEAKELLASINNILDFAKLESAHAELMIENVELSEVLERCSKRCRPLIGDKPVELTIELDTDAREVRADFVKLSQVFTNLIANAIKFTERGSVSVRARKVAGDKVAVDVSDTGIGIEGPALETIWSAFRQADSRISKKYGGTGLGLAIAKGVVDRLGGEVAVRSTVGEGTVFTVTLPAAAPRT